MEAYTVFKDLAIIIIIAKVFGILARKCRAPQVVGEIIAGLLIGPCVFGWVSQTVFLTEMAEIGVILLMFSAGLETDLKELIKTGPVAFLIACCGVFVPLICGAGLYMAFYGVSPWGSEEFYKAVFMGTILTATSVSITVECLKEMGKLKGHVGTTILSAAIIDDVIGIVVLTFVIGFKSPDSNPFKVVISTLLFFVFAIVVGFIAYHIFAMIDERYTHTRRIPITGFAFCLAMAYVAERYFGIADITGAYVAGIILCSVKDAIPMLTLTRNSLYCPHSKSKIRFTKGSACSLYGIKSRNSSPPIRAAISEARVLFLIVSATYFSTSSPNKCPYWSFACLNLSKSNNKRIYFCCSS